MHRNYTRSAPTVGETPDQRATRLLAQARTNKVRLRHQGEGRYLVPSQRRAADGTPHTLHLVSDLRHMDIGFVCSCEWGIRHGPYSAENEGALCAHIAVVLAYQARRDQAEARALRQWYAAQEPPEVTYARLGLIKEGMAA